MWIIFRIFKGGRAGAEKLRKINEKRFGILRNYSDLYYMRLRDIGLILLMVTLLITHNPCRMRVSPLEAEPAPRSNYFNR